VRVPGVWRRRPPPYPFASRLAECGVGAGAPGLEAPRGCAALRSTCRRGAAVLGRGPGPPQRCRGNGRLACPNPQHLQAVGRPRRLRGDGPGDGGVNWSAQRLGRLSSSSTAPPPGLWDGRSLESALPVGPMPRWRGSAYAPPERTAAALSLPQPAQWQQSARALGTGSPGRAMSSVVAPFAATGASSSVGSRSGMMAPPRLPLTNEQLQYLQAMGGLPPGALGEEDQYSYISLSL